MHRRDIQLQVLRLCDSWGLDDDDDERGIISQLLVAGSSSRRRRRRRLVSSCRRYPLSVIGISYHFPLAIINFDI